MWRRCYDRDHDHGKNDRKDDDHGKGMAHKLTAQFADEEDWLALGPSVDHVIAATANPAGRPPLNLMTPEMVAALKHTFDRLHGDERVRAAVISGAGRVMTPHPIATPIARAQ